MLQQLFERELFINVEHFTADFVEVGANIDLPGLLFFTSEWSLPVLVKCGYRLGMLVI